MKPLPLTLRPTVTAPIRQAVAGVYLSGGDAAVWLAEVACWPAEAAAGVRFCVLPTSVEDARPGGVLILPGGGHRVPCSARALPCVEAYAGVWVLAGTELAVSLLPEDVGHLFLQHIHFIHPGLGLIGWESADLLPAAALLSLPQRPRGITWEMSTPGPPPLPPLRGVALDFDRADLSFLDKAGEGIGERTFEDFTKSISWRERVGNLLRRTRSWAFFSIPVLLGALGAGLLLLLFIALRKGTDEAKHHWDFILLFGGVVGAIMVIHWLKRFLQSPGPAWAGGRSGGRAVSGTAAGVGSSAAGRSGILNYLRDQISRHHAGLQKSRQAELERLMTMLQKNPAEGLRYALPIGGQDHARGYAATPGGQLSLRNPTLGGAGTGGGGVVDPWNLDTEWRWKLTQRYQELARQESAKGNHDRAAYIYGELLGNWGVAAQELAKAGKYRQAAQLMMTKWNNKAMAADWLLKGGLLAEAAQLFLETGNPERAGDIYLRLGRQREAVAAYLLALRQSSSRVHSARLLADKMKLHGWAAAVLASGWPHTQEAKSCLEAHFKLLADCGAHEEADIQMERLEQVANHFLAEHNTLQDLAHLSRQLPFPKVQARMKALGRRIIARQVTQATTDKGRQSWLGLLTNFDPGDELLRRDVRKYKTRKVEPLPLPLRTPQAGGRVLRPSRLLPLGTGVEWISVASASTAGKISEVPGVEWMTVMTATTVGQRWAALGVDQRGRSIVLWEGDMQALSPVLTCSMEPLPMPSAWLAPDLQTGRLTLLAARTGHPLHHSLLRPGSGLVSSIVPLIGKVLAVTANPDGLYYALARNVESSMLELWIITPKPSSTRIRSLGWASLPPEVEQVPMLCLGDDLFLALGDQLYWVQQVEGLGDPKLSAVTLPGIVSRLVGTLSSGEPLLAVGCGSEVVLLRPKHKWEPTQLSADHDLPPTLCFLADGNLVIGDEHEATVMGVHPKVVTLATLEYAHPTTEPPVAIVPLDVSSCGILLVDGTMQIYQAEAV